MEVAGFATGFESPLKVVLQCGSAAEDVTRKITTRMHTVGMRFAVSIFTRTCSGLIGSVRPWSNPSELAG